MNIRFLRTLALTVFAVACFASSSLAQPMAQRLLERTTGPSAGARGMSVAAIRRGFARVEPRALNADRIELSLFDDVQVIARRSSRTHPRIGSTVWHGRIESPGGGEVTLASVDGVVAGNITIGGRLFEIVFSGGGLHEIRESNPALFPAEEPPLTLDLASSSGTSTVTTSSTGGSDASGQIDVMVVWTPAARAAVGGTPAAIQSVVDLAVANANASYANSGVSTSLRLVYSGEVDFTETTSSISDDLYRLQGTGDGRIDQVHTLRNQYGADVVTLMGNGYAGSGACGIGFLMSSVSTSFASQAFNVVDQSCAGGYLSYAHEVGHNQGLQHDPANAGGTPSYSYAYGYQDPAGGFRTVMSYGGATRVQHFSNPSVMYAGRPTGTSAQNNAEALNRNAGTVANFRSSSTTTACSYTLTPTSLTFTETSGTAAVEVTTTPGCAWSTSNKTSWVTLGPGGSGPGSVVITVAANASSQRTAAVTVAGMAVNITQMAAPTSCTYAVSPTSLSIGEAGGVARVTVTAQSTCPWTVSGDQGWVTVAGSATGSGAADVTVAANSGGLRTATLTVAGQAVTVTQAAASVTPASSCSYTLSATALTLPSSGGSLQVRVSAPEGCTWSSRSNTGWLKVSGTGVGSGYAVFQVNGTSGGSRNASATVAGQTVNVTQLAGQKGK